MNNKYAKAYTEVLEILRHFTEEEYSRIPKEKCLNISRTSVYA